MRRLLFTAILGLAVGVSGLAKADDAQKWAVHPSDTWTLADDVQVRYWFTENQNVVGQASLFIGPLLPGEDRPIVTTQFVGSGRNICVFAEAFRGSEPSAVVQARNNGICYRFPFGLLDSFSITVTP